VDPLAEYLQGEYVQDTTEIEQFAARTHSLVRFFLNFFRDGGWPYELSSGKDPGPSTHSHSTEAMILFALAAVTGRVSNSLLVPAIKLRPLVLSDSEQSRFDRVLQRGIDALVLRSGASKPSGAVTTSPTFGPNDPFTLTWFLETLEAQPPSSACQARTPGVDPAARVRAAAVDLVTQTFEAPDKAVLLLTGHEEAIPHAFPLLRVIHLLKALEQANAAPTVDPALALRTLADHLHFQLSLSDIPESAFDAGELVFSLEGWLLCSPSSPDEAIIDRVFTVLAARQARDPYWRPVRPFKVTPQGLVLLPQSVEIANSLLRITRLLGDSRDYFSEHVNLFRRYSRWLETRRFEGRVRDGRPIVGWESEHTYLPDRVHLWQTSQVLLYLQHYTAMLQRHVARTSLKAAGISTEAPPRDSAEDSETTQWAKWAAGEPLSDSGAYYRVYDRIGQEFVAPRVARTSRYSLQRPLYSMLLYGPPGTGKSSVARELARSLGYRLVTITPSDFLSAGSETIEARAKAIFKMLEEQSEFVILFDEIDRLLLDRDSEWYSRQSDLFQLLTPGMLTKLNDLAKKQQSILVLATNYRERIDPAIKRAGRIDSQYLVMPPDSAQRERILAGKKGVARWKSIPVPVRDTIRARTVFFSYVELTDLARRVSARGSRLSGRALGRCVREVLDESRPAIALGPYESRLKRDDVGDRKPLQEFAMLVSLDIQAGGQPERAGTWVAAGVQEALGQNEVRDEAVAEVLRKRFPSLA
jgi:hypothetical protein